MSLLVDKYCSKMSDNTRFWKTLREQFPYIIRLERPETDGHVRCTVCMTDFPTTNNERMSIVRHIGTSKHQKAVNMASTSLKLTVP